MENFEIVYMGVEHSVLPLENGTFKVSRQGISIGVVYPQTGTLSIEWKGLEGIDDRMAGELGELISQELLDRSAL
ncbi:MAG: hypothetical protein EOO45_14245 [Flavobacterium sp.]|nr:MAG: hypothetical protein EOO45_14245 [Flavobacterium sp.]